MAEIPEEPNALADDVGSPAEYEHAAPTIAAQPPPADELSEFSAEMEIATIPSQAEGDSLSGDQMERLMQLGYFI
jgi:hypothetical protein